MSAAPLLHDALEHFRNAIANAGLNPPDTIEADGALHRFASNGKRSDLAGWYVLHGDGVPAGAFGCWRSGLAENWRADIGRTLTNAERERMESMRRQREQAERERHAEAAR
jgi:putative DNA primase/helicase